MIRPLFIFLFIALVAGLVLFRTQSGRWPTGRASSEPLDLVIGGPEVVPPARVWIDTDAACGATPRTDPDDCLAIAWLTSRGFDITGISTSFGNAAGDVVEQTVRSLVATMTQNGMPPIAAWTGLAEPPSSGEAVTTPGVTALRAALEGGPLTILALGPLTNLAAALDGRPDLQGNVTRVIAVMGHRPGHLFHPTEGRGAGALFGHGPIFRDLNFSMDPEAARQILALNLNLTLVPYDAAHKIMITGPDLDRLRSQGPVFAGLADTARGWLAYWNDDIGLPGFYPFDWMAAAYLAKPRLFDCARTKGRIAREWAFWLIPRKSLLVGPPRSGGDAGSDVLYCPQAASSTHDFLLSDPVGQ